MKKLMLITGVFILLIFLVMAVSEDYDNFDDDDINRTLWDDFNSTNDASVEQMLTEDGGRINIGVQSGGGDPANTFNEVLLNTTQAYDGQLIWTSNIVTGGSSAGAWGYCGVEIGDTLIVFRNRSGGVIFGNYTQATWNVSTDGSDTIVKNGSTTVRTFPSEILSGIVTFRCKTNNGAGPNLVAGNQSFDDVKGQFAEDVLVLNHPADNIQTVNTSLIFNASYSLSSGTLINATVSLWFSDNATLFNATTETVSGSANSTQISVGGFIPANYTWGFQRCKTDNTCLSSSNRTFFFGLIEQLQEFNASTTEGSSERFLINITTNGDQVSTAFLVYNASALAGTIDNSNNPNITITRDINIPSVSASGPITFFWNITLANGLNYLSADDTQTINKIGVDDCSTHDLILVNYTLRDEENQEFLVGSSENTSIETTLNLFTLDRALLVANFSQLFNQTNPAAVCANSSALTGSFSMDVVTRYETTSRAAEFHNIQNLTITSTTANRNITLFDLKSTDSTEFLITFKDNNFLPVPDALIQITRQYVSEGVFKAVEIPKTDSDGRAIGHFDLGTVLYTLIVTKMGQTLATFSNVVVVCADESIGDCKINLNALSGSESFPIWTELEDLIYAMSFDETARTITTSFIVSSGTTRTINVTATKFDRFGNNTVCSDQLTSSSGSLTCSIPASFGNVTVIAELRVDGSIVTTRTYSMNPSSSEVFGDTGLILTIILMMTLPLMFISSPIGILLGSILGLIITGLLLTIETGSSIGPTSALIWFVVALGVVIWKISQKNKDGI